MNQHQVRVIAIVLAGLLVLGMAATLFSSL